jgi:uncharacterized RDD family membrane protein YckC
MTDWTESWNGPGSAGHGGSRDRVEAYVAEVLRRVPPPLPQRDRIAEELRSHLEEQVEAGRTPDEAIRRMGAAEEVARQYLAEVDFVEASIARRTGAFLLDLALGLVVLAPVWGALAYWIMGWATADTQPPPFFGPFMIVAMAALVAIPVLALVYFPVFEALRGQTLGKRWLGIYVVRETGEAVGWGPAILRRLPFVLEIFWIDALFALFTERRQRAFDLVARTVVVRQ